MEISASLKLPSPFIQAQIDQSQSPMFKATLPEEIMRNILHLVLLESPQTKVSEVCKAMNESYKDITNLRHALDANDFKTIELIVSVITATSPTTVEAKLLNFLKKIILHTLKSKNYSHLVNVLKLPEFSSPKFYHLINELNNSPLSPKEILAKWAFQEQAAEVIEWIFKNEPALIQDLFFNRVTADDSFISRLIFSYLNKNSFFDHSQLHQALVNSLYTSRNDNADFSFAYEILEDYKAKSQNANIEKIETILLRKEVKQGNVNNTKELLKSSLVNPSIDLNAVAKMIIGWVQLSTEKNNHKKRDEFIDLFKLVLDHPKFDPEAINTLDPPDSFRVFDMKNSRNIWMCVDGNKDIAVIFYSHPKILLRML